MSNSVIRAELEARLKTWADAQLPKVPVSYEGVAFTKPTDGVFLESFLLPTTTIDVNVDGSRKRYLGIFQINCWAKSGSGMRPVETLAQEIIDLYPILPKSGAVSIEATPEAERAVPDTSGWMVVPVVIEYRYES